VKKWLTPTNGEKGKGEKIEKVKGRKSEKVKNG